MYVYVGDYPLETACRICAINANMSNCQFSL